MELTESTPARNISSHSRFQHVTETQNGAGFGSARMIQPPMTKVNAATRLIVALDLENIEKATHMVQALD